jgi:hypothetical protein
VKQPLPSIVRCIVFVLLASLLTTWSTTAAAALFTVQFTGTVNAVDPELAGTFSVGQAFNGSYIFESTTPNTSIIPNIGSYDAITSYSATIGGYSATRSDPLGFPLITVDNAVPQDDYQVVVSMIGAGPNVGSTHLFQSQIFLVDPSGTAFSDALLPTSLDLSDFDSATFSLTFRRLIIGGTPPATIHSVGGPLDSLSITLTPTPDPGAVPEPSTLCIFGIGSLGLVGLVHPRRKRAQRTARWRA